MAFDPTRAAKRYQQSMQSPDTKQRYVESVNATTVNPMELAANAEDLYLRKVQEASQSGRRAAKLRSVPADRWKKNAAGKGANRLSDGAGAAADKVSKHFQEWASTYQEASDAVKNMPKGTPSAALDRVRTAMEILMRKAGKL